MEGDVSRHDQVHTRITSNFRHVASVDIVQPVLVRNVGSCEVRTSVNVKKANDCMYGRKLRSIRNRYLGILFFRKKISPVTGNVRMSRHSLSDFFGVVWPWVLEVIRIYFFITFQTLTLLCSLFSVWQISVSSFYLCVQPFSCSFFRLLRKSE